MGILQTWCSKNSSLYKKSIVPLLLVVLTACGGGSSSPEPVGDMPDDPLVDTNGDTPNDPQSDVPSDPEPTPVSGPILDVAGGQFYQSGNNSGLITGPVLESVAGTLPGKELAFTLDESSNDFVIRHIYVIGLASGNSSSVIGVVQNISSELQCRILITPGDVRDGDGVVLDDFEFSFAEAIGSAATSSTAGTIFSCLYPGEVAYFRLLGFFNAENATSMSIDAVRGRASDPSSSVLSSIDNGIVPISYSIVETNSAGQIKVDVLVVNQSSEILRLGGAIIVPLDSQGKPLDYAVADGVLSLQLDPGEEAAVRFTTSLAFTGPASSLRAVFEFNQIL